MKEDFLHFLWELQYFNKTSLKTLTGEDLHILHPGYRNKNSGPDFSQAKIIIDGIEWHGQVEIHINSSDWYLHHHSQDAAYENVILHVVWNNDKDVLRMDGTTIPVVNLSERTDISLVKKYLNFLESPWEIPCKNQLPNVPDIQKVSMIERALMNRLEDKSNDISSLLRLNNNDWNQTAFNVLAKNFGFKVNAATFLRLSQNISYKVILKHNSSILQLESLLFGQAGLLEEDFVDDYPNALKKEYKFLASKYSLSDRKLNSSEWKFSKLRPPNFPTIRLSQFAAVLFNNPQLFNSLLEFDALNDIQSAFKVCASEYWSTHYVFGTISKEERKSLGITSIENIVINTVAPILVCYARERDEPLFLDKAVMLLELLKAEENNAINTWKSNGIEIKTAAESQGALELYNSYCTQRKCLDCSIGYSLLNAEVCSI